MRILQVNTADVGGGAEAVARQLFEGFRSRGHWSRLAVGVKHLDDPDIVGLPRPGAQSLIGALARALGNEPLARAAGDPARVLARLWGSEDVNAPASWAVLDRFGLPRPDILHCHNLHGSSYFDLRSLPFLSRRVPLVITLHDSWLLSGHCAQSIDCERWRTGCGHCPDLTLYPAIRRDNTAANFQRKRAIFSDTKIYLSAPSAWLLDRARGSHLSGSIVDARVIPNAVEIDLFIPADRIDARRKLGLPIDAQIVLFVAQRGAGNSWKDYATLRAAVERLAVRDETDHLLCIVLGREAPTERAGRAEFRYLGAEGDRRQVARLYQAADLYVHATRADNFPLAILEALACGTPVVASAVGGITEQVRHLAIDGLPPLLAHASATTDEATGVLVPAGDDLAMTTAISALLHNRPLLLSLGANARRDALRRFGRDQIVDAWLAWYAEILASRTARA